MADVRSPHWNEQSGVCEKHTLQVIPCPQCAAERDPDVQVHFNLMDLDIAHEEKIPLSDLLPGDFAWCNNLV